MLSAVGLALSLSLSLLALACSRRAIANYFASGVYGMTPAVHVRYAMVSSVFALVFCLALVVPAVPPALVMAAFAVFMVFYLSSFARGFGE